MDLTPTAPRGTCAPGAPPAPLRTVRLLLVGVLGVYVVGLLVGRLGRGGPLEAVGTLSGGAGLVGLAVLLVVRAVRVPADRAAWAFFAAAVCAYVGGSLWAQLHFLGSGTGSMVSGADVGWLAFYPLAFTALVLMLRAREWHVTGATCLDGVVAGLTAAAVGASLTFGAALHITGRPALATVVGFTYPLADLLLLVLLGGALTVMGPGSGGSWALLATGLAAFVVTDGLVAMGSAQGTYVPGGPLDAGYALAFLCLGGAACLPHAPVRSRRLAGLRALAVPGICALSALALLLVGYLGRPGSPVAGALAAAALLAALGRAALTFRAVQQLAQSREQARTDELTGLANRRGVYESLREADELLAAGARVALLVVDLDRFKEINDSLGHAAGDAVLQQIGPRLSGRLRGGDVLGRMGGDEFVLLVRDIDPADAVRLGERVRAELQRPVRYGDLQLGVDASIGIALGPVHSGSARELLQLADLAMYSAKSSRAGVVVYDERRDGGGRYRLETIEQLRAGIAGGELVLHFQPKLDLRTGVVTGAEALVRWAHPTRGLLYPDAFIDLAESAGLVEQLTSAVLDAALAQVAAWREQGLTLGVAVNVSPSNLVDEHFPDEVAGRLRQHGLTADVLVLEVTETVLMTDRDRAVGVLERLRDAGVGIAIDDYGTGYSSLAYLAALPVTELKLDRSFLAAVRTSERTAAVVTSAIRLAQTLGLEVVAEGVEDQDTLDLLTALGCDLVQGYHVSRPQAPGPLAAWLRERSTAAGTAPSDAVGAGR